MNEEDQKKFDETWAQLDKNGDGVLENNEAKSFVEDLMKESGASKKEIDETFKEIWNQFLEADTNCDGKISKEEMRKYILQSGFEFF